MMQRTASLFLAAAAVIAPTLAHADNWPTRPIKWIVPYPPGGSTDMLARLVGQKLSERLGQSVVIENKPGAGGNLGTDFVAKQPGDGYTILMGNIGPISINPSLYPSLPYSPLKDLTPVTLLMEVPNLLVVNNDFPAHTVKELTEQAKSKGSLSYATPGAGTSLHLAGELYANSSKIKLTHVPYKGSSPGLADTMGGHIPMMFDNMPSALQMVKAGKLRAVAITSAKRSPQLPDVPTMEEAGVPNYQVTGWFGVLVPSSTPQPIVQRLSKELVEIVKSSDVEKRIADMGGMVSAEGPAQFTGFIQAETKKWRTLVQSANITLQ
ncbi:hypothetical protein SDC9_66805 [bioreactor metagenome]|uniref:Tripartite tricarboxylate transporter family receptor n=1 Tax=bioreactor metagenome TaxID=1076179 RepID=A0A644XVX8_9ZZZZ